MFNGLYQEHVSELLLQSVGLIATESEFEEIIP